MLYQLGVTDEKSIKATLINTAFKPDAADSVGWETGYGWGMPDVDHAAFHGTNGDYFEHTVTATGSQGDKKYYLGTFRHYDADNNAYDRATVVWNRHVNWSYADTSITAKALTNINLFIYDPADGQLVASSTSAKDNVEQVYWNSAEDTLRALVIVDCESSLPSGYSSEPFSLATEEGFEHVTNPIGLAITNYSTPQAPLVNVEYQVVYKVKLDGIAWADTIYPSLTGLDAHTSIVSGPTPAAFFLDQGDSATFSYSLVSTTTGQRTITGKATSTCYRRPWIASVNTTYTVVPDMGGGKMPAAVPTAPRVLALTAVEQRPEGIIVHYESPAAAGGELRVYGVNGRRVTRQSVELLAGQKTLVWPMRDAAGARVANGVYVLELRAGSSAARRKVVITR